MLKIDAILTVVGGLGRCSLWVLFWVVCDGCFWMRWFCASCFVVCGCQLGQIERIPSLFLWGGGLLLLLVGLRLFLWVWSLIDIYGEFDPGSGRTLAACLTHASRTVKLVLAPVEQWRTGE